MGRTPTCNTDYILNESLPTPLKNRSELKNDSDFIEIPVGADFINQGSPVNDNSRILFNINNSSSFSDLTNNNETKQNREHRDLTRVIQNLTDKERKL